MNISCRIIEDLLPLYCDNICSEESRQLVDTHLQQCESCKAVLNTMLEEVTFSHENADDKKNLEGIRTKWNKSKRRALITGIAITLAITLLLFAQISVSWYRNTALFYVELGERMGVSADFPHEYGPTTPKQAEEVPPKYMFPKEYFLGTSSYEFWLRTPSFLSSQGSLSVTPTQARGQITDKYGNVIVQDTFIHLTVHFTEEKTPEYYVTLENEAEDLYALLVLDGNCNLLRPEQYQKKEELLYDQAALAENLEEIKQIIDAAKLVWELE